MVNWQLLAPLIVATLTAIFSLYQARKADQSAKFSKTMEAGVTSLVDQLQEQIGVHKVDYGELKDQYRECDTNFHKARLQIRDLDEEVYLLKRRVTEVEAHNENYQAIIAELQEVIDTQGAVIQSLNEGEKNT